MDFRTPDFIVFHHLLELAQTHVHWVSDAIQPSHPLLPTSPPALNFSQYQGLFQWVNCSHQVAKVLELQLQHQSFQWIFRIDFLHDWLVWSPCSPRDSQESPSTPQFKNINPAVLSLLYNKMWSTETIQPQNNCEKAQEKWGGILKNIWSVLFKYIKIMKNKERQDFFTSWRKQRNIISNSMKELRFDPQQVKYIDRKIDEIQIKYVI